MPLITLLYLQLVIYGLDGPSVPNEDIQLPGVAGAIHNITQYLVTYLVPGGPIVPINAIITAVNDNHETAEVAAAFNKAVAAGFIPQLEALLKEVSAHHHCNYWICMCELLVYVCMVATLANVCL